MLGAPTILVLEALVDETERPAMIAAAEQLSECLTAASPTAPWSVRLNCRSPGALIPNGAAPSAIITSLLSEVSRPLEPASQTKSRWGAYLSRLQTLGAPVFVCTVFRYVIDRSRAGEPSPTLEKIRRLDRLAADLSHDLGVGVIDIDRAFAHLGGRMLKCDYHLSGALAAEVAGHTTAWSLLSFGLDSCIDIGVQEKAKAILGGLSTIDGLVRRRLATGKVESTHG